MNLKGQVAVVTGASQGIGRAVAELLGRAGASVLVNYIGNDDGAAETMRAIEASGGKAEGFNGDISVKANIEKMFKICTDKLGKPDILVANAGVGVPPKPLAEITEEDYRFVFDINYKGTLFCLVEAMKRMNDGGRIVVVTSSTIRYPVEGLAVYTSSKSALQALVEVSAPEFAQRGITINSVQPGLTVTPMTKGDLDPGFMKMVEEASPFHRLGQPEDVAEAIGFLCEKRSQWVSGQHITANGGSKF
ncbi:MAG: SDR family oxidoreductase [Clostridiales bacterium]|nr:SDR family oxidoreductase [Clostridiales bacterium]